MSTDDQQIIEAISEAKLSIVALARVTADEAVDFDAANALLDAMKDN